MNIQGSRDEDMLHVGRLVFRKTQDNEALVQALKDFQKLLPVLEQRFLSKEADFEMVYLWGRFQYCSGILMASLMGEGDDLGASRGGSKSGQMPRDSAVEVRQLIAAHLKNMNKPKLSIRSAAPYVVKALRDDGFDIGEEAVRKHISALRKQNG